MAGAEMLVVLPPGGCDAEESTATADEAEKGESGLHEPPLLLVHWSRRPGRQLSQILPAFTQAHPAQRPVLLHLQQTILPPSSIKLLARAEY